MFSRSIPITLVRLSFICSSTAVIVACSNLPQGINRSSTVVNPSVASIETQPTIQTISAQPTSSPLAIASGAFITATQPTSGIARISQEAGIRYAEFDSTFRTAGTENLRVLLLPEAVPSQYYAGIPSDQYASLEILDLGALTVNQGAQRYPIPNNADLNVFRSIAIINPTNDTLLGYAPLQSIATSPTPTASPPSTSSPSPTLSPTLSPTVTPPLTPNITPTPTATPITQNTPPPPPASTTPVPTQTPPTPAPSTPIPALW